MYESAWPNKYWDCASIYGNLVVRTLCHAEDEDAAKTTAFITGALRLDLSLRKFRDAGRDVPPSWLPE